MRFSHENMSMLLICDEKVLTRCDPVRVVAGADPKTGKFIEEDWASLGAQFRDGQAGFICQVIHI